MAYPQAGHPGAVDPLWPWFSAVAGADQQIDATELQTALTQSGISGGYQQFSLETCRVMISMLDRDYSGSMGFTEFKELWTAINQWKQTFMRFDADRSGTVEPHELHQAVSSFDYSGKMGFNEFKELWTAINQWKETFMKFDADRSGTVEPHELQQAVTSFGYNLSAPALGVLVKRYSKQGRITFDDFVACVVRLRALTAVFQSRDAQRNGMATFQFDDFIRCVMSI